ncbi:MAG: hypothetical protein H7836_18065, partial [Magnetococcus sp. YQC-3]
MDKMETGQSDEASGMQGSVSTDGNLVGSAPHSQKKGGARRRIWPAWSVLIVYFIVNIYFGCLMEWQAYQYGAIDEPTLSDSFLFRMVYTYLIFHVAIILAAYRMFAYSFIFFITSFIVVADSMTYELGEYRDKRTHFLMVAKAHLFSAYPNLCQHQIVPGKKLSLCYGYWTKEFMDSDVYNFLIFNPGDELLNSNNQLTEEIRLELRTI